jgi:RimJ/RimL family protein N-acetyltransferase
MEINFKPTIKNEELIKKMVEWYNNPDISHFIHVNRSEEEPHTYTVEDVLNELQPHDNVFKYSILDHNLPIGEVSITKDFFLLMNKNMNSAWISIMIGDQSYWGKGIAKLAMNFLENTCRDMGFNRIELGVFENNTKAFNLYKSLGYKEFTRIKHFTYSHGKWCDDVRLEKYL